MARIEDGGRKNAGLARRFYTDIVSQFSAFVRVAVIGRQVHPAAKPPDRLMPSAVAVKNDFDAKQFAAGELKAVAYDV